MIVSVPSYSTPSEVHAEEGQVLVEGPDGVAVSLTPDAAGETAASRRARCPPAGAGCATSNAARGLT